jgi:para-nitrobenzyl esterase
MKPVALLVALGVAIATQASVSALIPDQVKVETGLLQGTAAATPNVRIFKGIPFAAPPVGANRWRAPQPAAKWEGVRKADTFGDRCIAGAGGGGGRRGAAPAAGRGRDGAPAAPAPDGAQARGRGAAPAAPQGGPAAQPPASENCLYVNVWTSADKPSDKRPVMVWIYGGGFTGGAGSEQRYDGERLSAKGPVVVTLNYRLGQFGFFVHPELTKESGHNASGNYGMMDAIAALQWVKRNIAAFGGDPNNVTVFGESAGAIMTSALIGSPQAKGLFKRAITQSGAWMGLTMARMATRTTMEQAGVKAMQDMGVASIADLRAKSTEEVASGLRPPTALVVDGYLIPEDLSITFAAGKQNDVDVLAGSNQNEGTFFQFGGATRAEQFLGQSRQKYGELTDTFLKLYPAASDAEANTSYLASYADETSWNMRQSAVAQNKRGRKGYVYYFTRVPRGADGTPSPRGATHTAEIQYAFNNPTGLNWDDTDRKVADMMSSYWANFAAKGDPNGSGLPAWPEFKSMTSGRAMIFGDTVQMETTVSSDKLSFFDSAYARQMKAGTN